MILDLECGGFTYKGVKGVNQPFLTYFFRVLPDYKVLANAVKPLLENDKQERIWTSYKVKRKFLLLTGERASCCISTFKLDLMNTIFTLGSVRHDADLDKTGETEEVEKFFKGLGKVWDLEQSPEKKSKAASKMTFPPSISAILLHPLDLTR